MLARLDALGNFDIKASMLNVHLALSIHFRGTQGNISRCTVKTVLQVNIDFCMTVLPTCVKAMLTAEYGIAAERMSTEGFAADRPIAPNNTAEGRAMNRRVYAVITGVRSVMMKEEAAQ